MPTPAAGAYPANPAEFDLAGGQILVCSATPPTTAERCVDVRPGFVATFDGDRVRFPLTVSGAGRRVQVAWIDLPGLDDAVTSMLHTDAPSVVRFGDRSACRRAIGAASTATIERRLARTSRAAGAALVTWTGVSGNEVDGRPYDVVVDGATGND